MATPILRCPACRQLARPELLRSWRSPTASAMPLRRVQRSRSISQIRSRASAATLSRPTSASRAGNSQTPKLLHSSKSWIPRTIQRPTSRYLKTTAQFPSPSSPAATQQEQQPPPPQQTPPSTPPTHAILNPRTHPDTHAPLNITLTPRAIARLDSLMTSESNPALCLRVTVESGGCHGFQYLMSLTDTSKVDRDEDSVFAAGDPVSVEEGGGQEETLGEGKAKVVIDSASLELLDGASVDYTMELIGSQFKVVGIKGATSSCGCGSSFDIGG